MTARTLWSLLMAVTAALGLSLPASAASEPASLKVMSRNIYLGTDLIPIAVAPTRADFEEAASRGFANVRATDFYVRARLLAREIKARRPDIIGIQEAALWRRGPKDGVASNETTVVFDWLRILRRTLKDEGLTYRRRGLRQTEFDFSGPTTGNSDIRLTMRDAIFVRKRKGLRITAIRGANFASSVEFALPGLRRTIDVTRGWIYVDAALHGKPFRVLNTHLEAYGSAPRLAQAKELIAAGGPARAEHPVILVGDLNSDPNGDPNGEGDHVPYRTITGFGFRDSWTAMHPDSPGYACCLNHRGFDGLPDLLDPAPFPADHRIDHILYLGNGVTPTAARRVGLSRKNRTASGMWPSDHGGTVTRFSLE